MGPLLVPLACLAIQLIVFPGAFAWCMVDRPDAPKRKETERNEISVAQKMEIIKRFEGCKGTKDAQHQQLVDWFNAIECGYGMGYDEELASCTVCGRILNGPGIAC